MSIFSARRHSRVKAAPNYRSLSPVLLPLSQHAEAQPMTAGGGPGSQTTPEYQEENLGAAKTDVQETVEARVDDGQAGKTPEQPMTEDKLLMIGAGHAAERHQRTNGDDIRLRLIKGVERMEGYNPHKPRPKPVRIFTFQDSGFNDHLGPRETAFRPNFGISADSGESFGGIKFRPGIGVIEDSSPQLRNESLESMAGLEEESIEVEGGVKQVTMVPLRNEKQAQVTFAAKEFVPTTKGCESSTRMSSAYDYEVKLEGDADTADCLDDKESASSSCYSCCTALRLRCCRRKQTAPDEENIISIEVDMYSRFLRAKKLVGITMSLCYLTTGIIGVVLIVVTFIVLLTIS